MAQQESGIRALSQDAEKTMVANILELQSTSFTIQFSSFP